MNTADFYLARDKTRIENAQRRYDDERARVRGLIERNTNEHGDFHGGGSPTELLVGKGRTDGERVQVFDGWKKVRRNYYPVKHIEYRTTLKLRKLRGRLDEAKKVARRNATKRPAYKKVAAQELATREAERQEKKRRQRDWKAGEIKRLRSVGCSNDWIRTLLGDYEVGRVLIRAGAELYRGEENWEAFHAVQYARNHDAYAWTWYENGELDTYCPEAHLIAIAVTCKRRHENSDYEELLEAGFDREEARFCATPLPD